MGILWRASRGTYRERCGHVSWCGCGISPPRALWTLFLLCACGVAMTAVTHVAKTFASNQAGKNQNLPVLQ